MRFNKRLNWLQLNSGDFLLGDHSGRTSQVDQLSIYYLLLSEGIYSV